MNYLLLTRDPLDINVVSNLVADDGCGAISIFVGTTRDNFNGKKVLSLEYEAYEPMAAKELQSICSDLRSHWPELVNIAIYHRLGLVPVREPSIIIAVSSPHRQAALDAISLAIQELKKRVPIWKKERYVDMDSTWKENKEYRKRIKFDLDCCAIEDGNLVPENLIQISVAEGEIRRRIECFVEKKRNDIDFNNILDYTSIKPTANTESRHQIDEINTCARINSVIVRQDQSKYHVRVHRFDNSVGPQTRPDYFQALNKLMSQPNTSHKRWKPDHYGHVFHSNSPAIIERLETLENYLHLTPKKMKNVYERLKSIEKRILYLESISPEYEHFLEGITTHLIIPNSAQNVEGVQTICGRKVYSAIDLDEILTEISSSSQSS